MSNSEDIATGNIRNNSSSSGLASASQSQLTNGNKITLDQIASTLLKQNFVLTALEFHTELAENGRELPRLRDFFSNPANFEQQSISTSNNNYSSTASSGFFPLQRASSIQTFDSLDLTRYSDDVDQNKIQDDKIVVLEFELRKAKETINQLRNTLTLATESSSSSDNPNNILKSNVNSQSSMLNHHNDRENKNESPTCQMKSLTNNYNYNINKSNSNNKINSDEYDCLDDELVENLVDFNVTYKPSFNRSNKQDNNGTCKKSMNKLMPHDKNAINFLINEYLLEHNYKMTSITFSEENESQDLEDWDVVGLNRSKPPNLYQLYKLYLNKKKLLITPSNNKDDENEKEIKENKTKLIQEIPLKIVSEDKEVQTIITENTDNFTQTNVMQTKDFEIIVNLDHELFDNQRLQINKLLEKQEILLKSISKLETEIANLNSEREINLKKIDSLSIACEKSNNLIKTMNIKNKIDSTSNKVEAELILEKSSSNDLQNDQSNGQISSVDLQESLERKIPVVFKELLNTHSVVALDSNSELILDEIQNIKINNECMVNLLFKYLPQVTPYVSEEKRLILIPLILLSAVMEQEKVTSNSPSQSPSGPKNEFTLLKLLFNLIEKPNMQQRSMILNACIQFTKLVGQLSVNNYLLTECWEQINDKIEERRMLVAEACSILAPYIYNEMRSSLMFSILKQIIELEKSDSVRECACKSLGILVNYIKDEHKFIQCIDLLNNLATDSSDAVIFQVEQLLMPSMCLWALSIGKLDDVFLANILNKIEHHLIASNKQKYSVKKNDDVNYVDHDKHAKTYLNLLILSLQFVFSYILINFRQSNSKESDEDEEDNLNSSTNTLITEDCLSKLNNYYHKLQEKLDTKFDLYKLDSILEDYLSLTRKYLNLIETDSWNSINLSSSFTWLSDVFLRKLIQMSAQIDAKDPLCPYFVQLFQNFILLFAIDYELIRSNIIPIFEKLLNIPNSDSENSQQTAIEQLLNTKSCTLFRATLPVYFVGILSTLADVEIYGWFNLNLDLSNQSTASLNNLSKLESTPSSFKNEKVINSSNYKLKKGNDLNVSNDSTKTSFEKRIDYMNNYLKNVFFTLSLNQTNMDGLISIYEIKANSSDYIIQMLLSTLWDGIVHVSLYVRCNTAKLFEILVKDCDEYLLSTRILPALITLANDLDKMVRCSSISPLTSIIENCNNKEILERVFTQLQSFLSDPILKDEYLMQIELLKTFRRISAKVNTKFREEFILPYLTILTIQLKNVINDNDYEFPLSSFTTTYLAVSGSFSIANQFNSTITTSPSLNSISSSNFSSSYSIKDMSTSSQQRSTQSQLQQHPQNQQQDIQKILALLFENYQKICNQQQPSILATTSRQSIQESLLPGLNCLKELFQQKIIVNTISNSANSLSNIMQNDFVAQLENIIQKLEQPNDHIYSSPLNANNSNVYLSSSLNNDVLSSGASPMKSSPITGFLANGINIGNVIADTVNTTLASSSVSSISSINTNNQLNGQHMIDNANFKSFVFKGITNLKDQSKDKLSNFLLTNKNFKK